MKASLPRHITIVARTTLVCVLIFSGFVKAVDPVGTMYKLQEYATALGMGNIVSEGGLLIGAIAIAIVEFMLGVALLAGAKRKAVGWLTLILMVGMTAVSLYLFIANPIHDCGCFGDAVKLSNTQTLIKNIILLAAAGWIASQSGKMTPTMGKTCRAAYLQLSLLYVLFIGMYAIFHLPLIDFRPFHIGANIAEAVQKDKADSNAQQFETTFILEKDGVQREFTLDDYPDSTWQFVDRKTKVVNEKQSSAIHLQLTDTETQQDITEQLTTHQGYTVWLVAYNLDKTDQHIYKELNEIYRYTRQQRIPFYCLTASTRQQISNYRQQTAAEYPFAQADEATLKTMIRSNPGLIVLHDGKIQAKYSSQNLPRPSALTSKRGATPTVQTLYTATPYILLTLLLMLASFKVMRSKVASLSGLR